MNDRTALLTSLLQLDRSVKEIVAELSSYPSDAVEGSALVTLKKEQTISILQRYISGELTGDDIYLWADALPYLKNVARSLTEKN